MLHKPLTAGFPGGTSDRVSDRDSKDAGSIPGPGRSPEGRHGNPPQYFCLDNPMDRGTWQATVHRVVACTVQSQTQLKRLCNHSHATNCSNHLFTLNNFSFFRGVMVSYAQCLEFPVQE